jgi:CheY-like chemotaxis protein
MVSPFGREEALEQLAARGLKAADVLTKPITAARLAGACAAALGVALPAETGRIPIAVAANDPQPGVAGVRVLLAEDNLVNRELAVELLSGAGMDVTIACNGRQAIDLLEQREFDCVLMDCQMPVMDGYEATALLRQRPGLRELPIIAMTANTMAGDRDKAIAAGMNDYIAKPIDVDEMFATLARWVPPMHARRGYRRGS